MESVIEEQINKRRKVQIATYDKESGNIALEVTKKKNKDAEP